jgi:Uracil DNA glycosylase superfamily
MQEQVLNVLATARKNCQICMQRDPGQIFNGSQEVFDPPVASYWSQWLGHEAPKILVVGQDFSDFGYFTRNKGLDEANNTTNDNLRLLFAQAGLTVGRPPAKDTSAPVFLTNSILCLKNGAMNAQIKERWVKSCSTHHLVPLLAHLRPPIIVAMGKHGWMAVREALKLSVTPELIKDAAGNSWVTSDKQYIFAVGHCSGLGLVNRSWSQQTSDWKKIGTVLTGFDS